MDEEKLSKPTEKHPHSNEKRGFRWEAVINEIRARMRESSDETAEKKEFGE